MSKISENQQYFNTEISPDDFDRNQRYFALVEKWKLRKTVWTYLYDLGFNVVPTIPRTKEAAKKWKAAQTQRINRDSFLQRIEWEFKAPDSCDAIIITGNTPDMKVVVIDGDNPEAVAMIEQRCPNTEMQTISRNGRHYFYAHPGYHVTNRVDTIIDGKTYKIDIRGDGGYVVAPGSIHKTGHLYEWAKPWTADMVANLPVYDPTWLDHKKPEKVMEVSNSFDHVESLNLDHLPSVEERIDQVRTYISGIKGTQCGNDASAECFNLAIKLVWKFLIPEDDAVELLYEWGSKDSNIDEHGNYYPWTIDEIEHKVKDAIKATYVGTPGDGLRTDLDDRVEAIFTDARQATQKPRSEVYDQPRGRSDYNPRDFLGEEPSFDDERVPRPKPEVNRKRRGYRPSEIREFDDPAWLVEDHIVENTIAGIFGAPGSFKSFYGLDLAFSIATGTPFLGRYKVISGPVLYVYAEGRGGMRRRLLAWEQARGLKLPEDKVCIIDTSFSLSGENAEDEVNELLRICQETLGTMPTIIFIDTLSRNFGPGDENATKDMKSFVDMLDKLRDDKRSVVPIHHTGKDKARRERGSNVLRASVDTLISIDRENDGTHATVTCEKQKDGDPFPEYTVRADKVEIPGGSSLVLNLEDKINDPVTTTLSKTKQKDRHNLMIFSRHAEDATSVQDAAIAWDTTTETARKRLRDLHGRQLLERIDGTGTIGHSYYLSTRGVLLLELVD